MTETSLPLAPPSLSSAAATRASACRLSGGTVRKMVPSSLMVRSRMLVPVGQMVTRLRMVTPLAMAIDSGVMEGPIRQEAPWSTRLRAADRAAWGSPCTSAPMSLAVICTPALAACSLANWTASFTALSCEGPVSESGPVTSSSLPIVRFTGSACAPAVQEATARPAASIAATNLFPIIVHPPCQVHCHCEFSRGLGQSAILHDRLAACANIGILEHQPAMQARAVAAAGLDVFPDREPENRVAETMIGRKSQTVDPLQKGVAAKDELAQPVLVARLSGPCAIEGLLIAVGFHPPDAAGFEMKAQALVQPVVDIKPVTHRGVAESVLEHDHTLG